MAEPTAPETAYWNLEVECPHCELQGTVPWDRLSPKKRVRCRRCERWFRIDPQGSTTKANAPDAAITVAVRGASSDWTEHLAPESGRLERSQRRRAAGGWERLLGWRTGVASAAACCVVLVLGWWMVGGGAPAAGDESAYHEPESLADRAAAFSLAWACNDTATMARFTAPGQTKAFIAWLTRAQLATVFDDVQPNEVQAETISVAPREASRALVTVGLTLRSAQTSAPNAAAGAAHRDAAGSAHHEIWDELDGKWFFSPEETIKILASRPGM